MSWIWILAVVAMAFGTVVACRLFTGQMAITRDRALESAEEEEQRAERQKPQ